MSHAPIEVLYEDNHLLAVNKPAGVATMGLARGEPSLVVLAQQYLKEKYSKPGNVYVGVVSRLDAASSGVVLLARTSKAAARLAAQFRDRSVKKTYWAIIENRRIPASGECRDWLLKDEAAQRMVIAHERAPGAHEALLTFRRLQWVRDGALVEVDLQTGRKHQIRVQFAARGWAIWGDRKYGGRQPFENGIALHARRLMVEHPTRHEPLRIVAPLPPSWLRFGELPTDDA